MKYRTFIITFIFVVFCTVTGCDEEGTATPSEQDLTYQQLTGQWTLENGGSILLDDQDISLNYTGFELSFADGTYTTINAGSLFDANGTWHWTDGTVTNSITLGDGRVVTIRGISESQFIFSFYKANRGSAAGIEGNYVVTLTK